MSIPPTLLFDWSIPFGEFPADSMGRANHAKNLTSFLVQKGQQTSYVLNLNSKWGSGKSYFLKRWLHEIENIHPAVYIDAWSSDHSSDPLLTVVSEVKNKLRELKNIYPLEKKLFEGVAKAVKIAAPTIVKSIITGQLKRAGVNLDEVGEVFNNEDAAEAGAKLVEQAINAHNDAFLGINNIKKSIQDWLESVVSSNTRQFPLFIFIDELDRCRPTYAIEMLETIKHIFDIKNVVFIVATDKEQLQHSIKAIYGAEFNSRLYLDRFFTRTITLSNPSRDVFVERKINNSNIFTTFIQNDENFAFLPSDSGRLNDIVHLLAGIADGFGWPLRTVDLWMDRLESALIMSNKKLEIILLSFLMALETDDSDWLKKFLEKKSIFPVINGDNSGKVTFRSFKITTRWSFSMFEDVLDSTRVPFSSTDIKKTHDSKIGLLEFVTARLASLNKENLDPLQEIQSQFDLNRSGQALLGMNYGAPLTENIYPNVAMSAHTYFITENNSTLSNYIEICRHSSLMS